MSSRPIFVATHPRACSTAFERVFMTRRDALNCVHEPFGDAFYFGPERLSERYADDEEAREKSGFAGTTYQDVLDQLEDAASNAGKEGKRVFIKDITHYLFPPHGKPAKIAPSVSKKEEPGNPTVLPLDTLRQFDFTFLIRHPRRSIPSYYRCTVPPLDEVTGFSNFMPSEAGYDEVRRLVDFLLENGIIDRRQLVVVDADDLLDDPEAVIRAYCERVGLDFSPSMLQWNEEDMEEARVAFAKWEGFHNDAINSTSLKPRAPGHKTATRESEDAEWKAKFGEESQKEIRACVEANVRDYEYLKKFAIKV